MFSYNPLWKTLIDKNLKKISLQRLIECSPTTIATMGKNEYVSMEVLDRICKTLHCKIEDVIEYKGDD